MQACSAGALMKTGNRSGFGLAEVAVVIVILAVLAVAAMPNFLRLKHRAFEASVKANAHTAQLAAEVYCIQTLGVYSDDPADLQPLFPDALPLRNPYTLGDVLFDGSVGDLSYGWTTAGVDYIITAFGKDDAGNPHPILVLRNL